MGIIKKCVKKQDMFGHTINLNFKEDNNKQNTLIGGIFTILLKCFMGAFVARCFTRMVWNQDDRTFRIENKIQTKDTQIFYPTTNVTVFHFIKK